MSPTHGHLRRYVVRLASTREAENFHHATDYVYRKEPTKLADVGRTYDGRTVILYAFSRYWTRKLMAKHARIYGGRVVGYGSVVSRDDVESVGQHGYTSQHPPHHGETRIQYLRRIAERRRRYARQAQFHGEQGPGYDQRRRRSRTRRRRR
jgi:hypothetical protein